MIAEETTSRTKKRPARQMIDYVEEGSGAFNSSSSACLPPADKNSAPSDYLEEENGLLCPTSSAPLSPANKDSAPVDSVEEENGLLSSTSSLPPADRDTSPVEVEEEKDQMDGGLNAHNGGLVGLVRPFHACTSSELNSLKEMVEDESWARRHLSGDTDCTKKEEQFRALLVKHLPLLPLRSATGRKPPSRFVPRCAAFTTPTVLPSTATGTSSPALPVSQTSSGSSAESGTIITAGPRKTVQRGQWNREQDDFLRHMVREAEKANKWDKFASMAPDWMARYPTIPKDNVQLRNRYRHLQEKDWKLATTAKSGEEGGRLFEDAKQGE
jgi:hypothetical protein